MSQEKIPFFQIRPGCILFYDMCYSNFTGSYHKRECSSGTVDTNEKYTGKMNSKSRSKLRFAINLLVAQARWKQVENPSTSKLYKFKINFITLTLSASQLSVTDKTIKSQMLEPWLRIMRKNYDLRSYVWRAERQKNGNLHFHITTDTYINYNVIRDVWNDQQSKFHFIRHFQNRNNSIYPNSTDVHSVNNIKNLASYLVKYMVKDEKGLESIEGKVWDCSKNLKLKDRVAFEMTLADHQLFNSLIDKFPSQYKHSENCSFLSLSDAQMQKNLPTDYILAYKKWLDGVYASGPVI